MNLIINGAEPIERNTGTVLVSTAAQDIDQGYIEAALAPVHIDPELYVFLEIHDTGVGMTPDVIAKILRSFLHGENYGARFGLARPSSLSEATKAR